MEDTYITFDNDLFNISDLSFDDEYIEDSDFRDTYIGGGFGDFGSF